MANLHLQTNGDCLPHSMVCWQVYGWITLLKHSEGKIHKEKRNGQNGGSHYYQVVLVH